MRKVDFFERKAVQYILYKVQYNNKYKNTIKVNIIPQPRYGQSIMVTLLEVFHNCALISGMTNLDN